MENRVNGANRIALNSIPVTNNAFAARNVAPAANATVNTLDASSFSRVQGHEDLAELQAVVAELEARIEALENQVAELQGDDAPIASTAANNNSAILPAGVSLPPLAAAGRVPAATETVTDELAALREALGPTGFKAVEHVLKGAKLTGLTLAEDKTSSRAMERVYTIGKAIAGGAAPGPYAAELFALKHTLADPAGAGKHAAVTSGAQTMAYIEEQKTDLAKLFELNDAKLQAQADPVLQREQDALETQYKSLVGIQKALEGAQLTGLSPAAEKKAGEAVDRLGFLAEAVGGGAVTPAAVEREVYQLAQGLKPVGTVQTAQVADAGADVVGRIAKAKSELRQRLSTIDDQIIAGAAPELFAAERTAVIANAEALEQLGESVKDAKLDQPTTKGRREVSFALAKAAAMADALGTGAKMASGVRGELFVLRNTLQEPVASKDNAAVQSGAAALQVFGTAEAANMAARYAIASGAETADVRGQDARLAKLVRQGEDLENMRIAIEGADFGGLTPAQEARGAELIDLMSQIGQRVAAGDDMSQYGAQYDQLATALADLKNYQGGAVAPTPTSVQVQPTAPQPVPVGPASVDPAPAGGHLYVVKKNDYLTKIAREQLGDPNRFREIVELNKDKYPSLVQNPDLIRAGWTLVMPGGAAAPAKPAKPSKPTPAPGKPSKPTPAKPVPPSPTPAGTGTSDQQAVAWLRKNLNADGRISKETIAKMPAGPGKEALLTHYDALLFGAIDSNREGWTHLHTGDIARLEQAIVNGQTIDQLASTLVRQVLVDRQVGDVNGDGRLSESDVRTYANELRGASPASPAKPPVPATNVPTPTPRPTEDANAARLRSDLDTYLANPSNKGSAAILHILNTAPQYAVNASAEQKARMMKQLIDGVAVAEERRGAVNLLRMADERGETMAMLKASSRQGGLPDLMHDLSGGDEGQTAVRLMLKAGAYKDPAVWQAMDDDASVALAKGLGFKEPMIGTNDQLRALPEAAKQHMIQQLLRGNLTWGELAVAEWINQHVQTKVSIPDYRNR